jgi:hypothetical protein
MILAVSDDGGGFLVEYEDPRLFIAPLTPYKLQLVFEISPYLLLLLQDHKYITTT